MKKYSVNDMAPLPSAETSGGVRGCECRTWIDAPGLILSWPVVDDLLAGREAEGLMRDRGLAHLPGPPRKRRRRRAARAPASPWRRLHPWSRARLLRRRLHHVTRVGRKRL